MPRRVHVAIVLPEYLEAILDGRKTVESRLSRVRCAPFGMIEPGERVYFRRRAGGYHARAVVADALCLEDLAPAGVRELRRRFDHLILGSAEYWADRLDARFATLIWLSHVEPVGHGPRIAPLYGAGWKIVAAPGPSLVGVNRPRPFHRLVSRGAH